MATVLVLVLDKFPNALDYTTFAIVLATIADTSALYVLRARPDAPRPYRAGAIRGYLHSTSLRTSPSPRWCWCSRPLECGGGLAMLAIGLPFY